MINDLVSNLPVNSKRKYSKRHLSDIEYIIIHHTAGGGTPESIARYHVSVGWPGIGYHYLINDKGEIFQTNRIDTVSYNVGGKNKDVIGIALIGNFETKKLTETQKSSIKNLVELLRVFVGPVKVKGHNDLANTLCPGKHIKQFIIDLNEQL